jgi:hypothetical protein
VLDAARNGGRGSRLTPRTCVCGYVTSERLSTYSPMADLLGMQLIQAATVGDGERGPLRKGKLKSRVKLCVCVFSTRSVDLLHARALCSIHQPPPRESVGVSNSASGARGTCAQAGCFTRRGNQIQRAGIRFRRQGTGHYRGQGNGNGMDITLTVNVLLQRRQVIGVLVVKRNVLVDGETQLDHAVNAPAEGVGLIQREAGGEHRRLEEQQHQVLDGLVALVLYPFTRLPRQSTPLYMCRRLPLVGATSYRCTVIHHHRLTSYRCNESALQRRRWSFIQRREGGSVGGRRRVRTASARLRSSPMMELVGLISMVFLLAM